MPRQARGQRGTGPPAGSAPPPVPSRAVSAIFAWPGVPRRQCGGNVLTKSGASEISSSPGTWSQTDATRRMRRARAWRVSAARAGTISTAPGTYSLPVGPHEVDLRVHVPENDAAHGATATTSGNPVERIWLESWFRSSSPIAATPPTAPRTRWRPSPRRWSSAPSSWSSTSSSRATATWSSCTIRRSTAPRPAAARCATSRWPRCAPLSAGYPSRFGESFRGERVPALSEVLAFLRDRCRVMIELKSDSVTDDEDGGLEAHTIERGPPRAHGEGLRAHLVQPHGRCCAAARRRPTSCAGTCSTTRRPTRWSRARARSARTS